VCEGEIDFKIHNTIMLMSWFLSEKESCGLPKRLMSSTRGSSSLQQVENGREKR
jgi:hypothetical protein